VVAAKARHFQRIADDAAGLNRQVLQVGVDVVMRHHHRVAILKQAANPLFQLGALFGAWLHRHARPSVLGGVSGLLVFDVDDGGC